MSNENLITVVETLKRLVDSDSPEIAALKISEYQLWLEESRGIRLGHFVEIMAAVLKIKRKIDVVAPTFHVYSSNITIG